MTLRYFLISHEALSSIATSRLKLEVSKSGPGGITADSTVWQADSAVGQHCTV